MILVLEGGVQAWRHLTPEPSMAPVFAWAGAPLVSDAPPPFGSALKVYRADRGAQRHIDLEGGIRCESLYFEWDDVEAGPFAVFAGHESEVCNVAAGFRLLSTGATRTHTSPEGERLEFRHTLLETSSGVPLHAYKAVWIQGGGDWHTGSSLDRGLRLNRSFIRLRGQARVLQGGVFGVEKEEEAWEIFAREVLSQVKWKETGKLKAES